MRISDWSSDVCSSDLIHADLFRDNAMFEGTHLTGLIDFYNACSGPMLYDVAIALNDWCSDDNGVLDGPRTRALLRSEERRVGKGWVRTCRFRWLPDD